MVQRRRNMHFTGLHTVRRKVSFEPHTTILPPDLFQKFQGMDFWRDLKASRANVITATRKEKADGAEAAANGEME